MEEPPAQGDNLTPPMEFSLQGGLASGLWGDDGSVNEDGRSHSAEPRTTGSCVDPMWTFASICRGKGPEEATKRFGRDSSADSQSSTESCPCHLFKSS